MPLVVIQVGKVAAITITRPTGFLPEQSMTGHRLRRPYLMIEFPGALQLMEVFGAQMLQVFLIHGEQFQARSNMGSLVI